MKDLSSMTNLETGLTAGESMAGGNTMHYTQKNCAMGAPGSKPVNKLPEALDDPKLEVPAMTQPTTVCHPGSAMPKSGKWTKAGE